MRKIELKNLRVITIMDKSQGRYFSLSRNLLVNKKMIKIETGDIIILCFQKFSRHNNNVQIIQSSHNVLS